MNRSVMRHIPRSVIRQMTKMTKIPQKGDDPVMTQLVDSPYSQIGDSPDDPYSPDEQISESPYYPAR